MPTAEECLQAERDAKPFREALDLLITNMMQEAEMHLARSIYASDGTRKSVAQVAYESKLLLGQSMPPLAMPRRSVLFTRIIDIGDSTHGCKKCEKLSACSCTKAADGGGFEFL
jgi:hypothetical protein